VNLDIFSYSFWKYRLCRRPENPIDRKQQKTPKRGFFTLYYPWVGTAAVYGGRGRQAIRCMVKAGRDDRFRLKEKAPEQD
jgi:hypothetical protein